MNIDQYLEWRNDFMKSLRNSYENKVFGLKPDISEVIHSELRPERNECINDDDIMNLRIALGASSFDEFLKQI